MQGRNSHLHKHKAGQAQAVYLWQRCATGDKAARGPRLFHGRVHVAAGVSMAGCLLRRLFFYGRGSAGRIRHQEERCHDHDLHECPEKNFTHIVDPALRRIHLIVMKNPVPAPLFQTRAYIDGEWCNADSRKTFDVTNPATGKVLAKVADAGAPETKKAIAAARAAFPKWSGMLASERATIMKKWFALVKEHEEDLARLLTLEQGKPFNEALGEIRYGASFIEWFAEEAKRTYGETVPSFKANSRIVVTYEPVGVCAAITPWNFPNSMITRKVSPGIAAGCTIVLKPASQTPLSALALAALAHEAGLPAGVLNIVTGTDSKTIGKVLSTHKDVDKLSFTGSTGVGRTLMEQAAPTLKRLSMELGGNAPFIVFDDADIEAAVKGAIASKFRNAGQTCVCTNRFYVQKGVYKEFAAKLAAAMKNMKIGDGLEKDVVIGPLIDDKAVAKVEELLSDAKAKGGKITLGGKPHKLGGTYYELTLVEDAKKSMKLKDEEIFGPVAALFPFTDEADVLEKANDVEHGLAAYVYTSDLGCAMRMSGGLAYGMVGVNEGIISTEVAPFGGVKQSGFGREGGRQGIAEYLNCKYTLFGGI